MPKVFTYIPYAGVSTLVDGKRILRSKAERLHDAIQKVGFLCSEGRHIPSDIIYSLINRCTLAKDLLAARQLHLVLSMRGFDSQVGDHLIRLFAYCNSLHDANRVFSDIQEPTVYTWNAIISAHSKMGFDDKALDWYEKMQLAGIQPDKFTFLPALKACGSLSIIGSGRFIHDQVVRNVTELDLSICNALIDMYLKCGSLHEGERLFNIAVTRDVISWGSLISGYIQHGCALKALSLFERMKISGMVLNEVVYSCLLKACGSIGAIEEGNIIYDQILKSGVALGVGIINHLVDMYVKCGALEEGFKALKSWPVRNIVSWSTLITGHVQHGHGYAAFELLWEMQRDGIKPDRVLFLSTIQACFGIDLIEQGMMIHDLVIRSGLNSDIVVATTLVNMYLKSEKFKEAYNVHQSLPYRDVVTWGVLICGYAHNGLCRLAVECFEKMKQDGIEPDSHIFSCTLKACADVGALEIGKSIHDLTVTTGLELNTIIGSALVDMYAKCGSLWEAWETLYHIQSQDPVSWNVLIAGYVENCEYILAQQCFQLMQLQGLKPDSATYISILAACSHAGKVEDGYWYFKSMVRSNVTPGVEHFNCMIDLLSRAGHLNDANKLLKSMPLPPNMTGWTSLLSACRKFENLDLGRDCFDKVV